MTLMTCQELIEQFLADYVDDSLELGVRARFDEHLSLCPACVDYLETYRQTIALARAAGTPAPEDPMPDPEVIEAIVSLLREQAER
ncbi:MAG: zf-HC2 domain-containing protein [Myxococcales bacterium]|nr:zf-HC2 domain-containing protein [Myxococcales bacterium]